MTAYYDSVDRLLWKYPGEINDKNSSSNQDYAHNSSIQPHSNGAYLHYSSKLFSKCWAWMLTGNICAEKECFFFSLQRALHLKKTRLKHRSLFMLPLQSSVSRCHQWVQFMRNSESLIFQGQSLSSSPKPLQEPPPDVSSTVQNPSSAPISETKGVMQECPSPPILLFTIMVRVMRTANSQQRASSDA